MQKSKNAEIFDCHHGAAKAFQAVKKTMIYQQRAGTPSKHSNASIMLSSRYIYVNIADSSSIISIEWVDGN